MARPWRIEFPGALYHVVARGNNRQAIFLNDQDRYDFLDLLARAGSRFRLHLFAFCLMNNHYHLFLRTPEPNLATAMKWLNGVYTMHFHRRHHRNGHLFQGRYKSVLVADEAHWLQLSMYLHLNPVRAGLVDDPGEYVWSSFRDYTRPRSRFDWIQPAEVLSLYGVTPGAQRKNYRRECLGLAGAKPKIWEEIRTQVILGTQARIEELARKHRPRGDLRTVPEFSLTAARASDVRKELARAAKVFGTEVSFLNRRQRDFSARLAAYYLVEHCGIAVTGVANALGVSPSAISHGVARFKKRIREDRALREKVNALKSKVKN